MNATEKPAALDQARRQRIEAARCDGQLVAPEQGP